jgi:hypothetical protein
VLTWRKRPASHFRHPGAMASANTTWTGKVAGCPSKCAQGYISASVTVDGVKYEVHRVIWKLVTDEEPPKSVDHEDGDTLNNRWSNLRGATRPEQGWNRPVRRDNRTGLRGAYFIAKNGRYASQITVDGVRRRLGEFETPEEAASACDTAARELHREFYRDTLRELRDEILGVDLDELYPLETVTPRYQPHKTNDEMDEARWPAVSAFLANGDGAIEIEHPCISAVSRGAGGYYLDWGDGDPGAAEAKDVFSRMHFVDDELKLRATLLPLAYPGGNR